VMFNKLKTDRSSKEYEEWFLKYRPDNTNISKKLVIKNSSKKNKTKLSQGTRKNKKTRSNKKKTRSTRKKTQKDRVAIYFKKVIGIK